MKTPWKFLAPLMSRRPSAGAQESSIGNGADTKALESEAEHTSTLPSSLAVAGSPPAHSEDVSVDQGSVAFDEAAENGDIAQALKPPIDAEEAQTAPPHEAGHSEANSLVPKSAASKKSQSKPQIKRREGGGRANAHVVEQSAVAPTHHKGLQPTSSRELFFHEMAILDEEIKMLRIQLAQKLHLQNGQLKKMLERFDVA